MRQKFPGDTQFKVSNSVMERFTKLMSYRNGQANIYLQPLIAKFFCPAPGSCQSCSLLLLVPFMLYKICMFLYICVNVKTF